MHCRILKVYFSSLYSPRAIADRSPRDQEGRLQVSQGVEVGGVLASGDGGGCSDGEGTFVDEGCM